MSNVKCQDISGALIANEIAFMLQSGLTTLTLCVPTTTTATYAALANEAAIRTTPNTLVLRSRQVE